MTTSVRNTVITAAVVLRLEIVSFAFEVVRFAVRVVPLAGRVVPLAFQGSARSSGYRTSMIRLQFLTSASLAASAAAAVPGGSALVERRANFDEAAFNGAVGKPADIRQMWENLGFIPGVFNNMKNSLNGLIYGYGFAPDRITLVAANHGPSSAYTFSDETWHKYRIGEFLKLKNAAGEAVTSNVFLARKSKLDPSANPDSLSGALQDTSIEALQSRGVVMLTCHTAVEEQAAKLVRGGFAPSTMSPSEVAADILTHLIPGAVIVPSMVATIAVLQHRFAYTYATVQS